MNRWLCHVVQLSVCAVKKKRYIVVTAAFWETPRHTPVDAFLVLLNHQHLTECQQKMNLLSARVGHLHQINYNLTKGLYTWCMRHPVDWNDVTLHQTTPTYTDEFLTQVCRVAPPVTQLTQLAFYRPTKWSTVQALAKCHCYKGFIRKEWILLS